MCGARLGGLQNPICWCDREQFALHDCVGIISSRSGLGVYLLIREEDVMSAGEGAMQDRISPGTVLWCPCCTPRYKGNAFVVIVFSV